MLLYRNTKREGRNRREVEMRLFLMSLKEKGSYKNYIPWLRSFLLLLTFFDRQHFPPENKTFRSIVESKVSIVALF